MYICESYEMLTVVHPLPPPPCQDSLIISHTTANTGRPTVAGLKTPNTPRLTVSNVTFVNFDQPGTTCLKACSHCKVRQGGFQVWFQQLAFLGGSEQRKTGFQWEHEVCVRSAAENTVVLCIQGAI